MGDPYIDDPYLQPILEEPDPKDVMKTGSRFTTLIYLLFGW